MDEGICTAAVVECARCNGWHGSDECAWDIGQRNGEPTRIWFSEIVQEHEAEREAGRVFALLDTRIVALTR
jgi:hypothetical protein